MSNNSNHSDHHNQKKKIDSKDELRMSSGARAGLQTGREVGETLRERQEMQRRRFDQMDHQVSGRGAQTVYRDRRGMHLY